MAMFLQGFWPMSGKWGRFPRDFSAKLGIFLAVALAIALGKPVAAAERITVTLGPFRQSLSVGELETFAHHGTLSPQLAPYGFLLTPQIQTLLRRPLAPDFAIADPLLEADFWRSAGGQFLLKQLQTAFPGTTEKELQGAIMLLRDTRAALTPLTLLRAYPHGEITVDLSALARVLLQWNGANLRNEQLLSSRWEEWTAAASPGSFPFATEIDPTLPGPHWVIQTTEILSDRPSQRSLTLEVYRPQPGNLGRPFPLVLMSHGFSGDRHFLEYLAHHLASHGFTVVSVEHPGSNLGAIQGDRWAGEVLAQGQLLPPEEFRERPQDLRRVLDEFSRRQRQGNPNFTTAQVTVIGHSLGGYTALALAGAKLDPPAVARLCDRRFFWNRAPADWLECGAAQLPSSALNLGDPRVGRVVVLNPNGGKLFGDRQLADVTVPVFMATASKDRITPALDHQLRPFQSLTTEKYLLMAIGASHMSLTDTHHSFNPDAIGEITGPATAELKLGLQGMVLAFLHQGTSAQAQYAPFLSSAYAQTRSRSPFELRLTQTLPPSLESWFSMQRF